MNRRTALKTMLAFAPVMVLPKQTRALTAEPMTIVLAIGTMVLVGGTIAFVLMLNKAASENDGNWGEGRFDGLDVRFKHGDIDPATMQEFYTWSSPPPDFRLLCLEEGTPPLIQPASNEQIAYYTPNPAGTINAFSAEIL